MGRPTLSPETFGAHATQWPDALFAIRVDSETQVERLRAAVRHEAQRSDPREERIARINRRIAELD